MNTILEIFQKDIASYPFRTIIDNLTDDQIYESIEEYANQFKTVWKYPEKNEFPEKDKLVYCVSGNNREIGKYAEKENPHFFSDKNGKIFFCRAWCELPVFSKA